MDHSFLAKLRIAVGLLGEKDHAGWWATSFFNPQSSAYLSPVFPRNVLIAQCQGTTSAAMKLHDDRIGVGNVYHLFRLPEDLERGVYECVASLKATQRLSGLANPDGAADFLETASKAVVNDGGDKGAGPIRVGSLDEMRNQSNWELAAARYAKALKSSIEVFPYFASVA